MISCMKAEYFRLAKEVAAIYALLREGMHIKGVDMGFDLYAGMSKYFCWPPNVNNLFSSERLQQERPAYHDKMNNVRFHRTGEIRGSCALCM